MNAGGETVGAAGCAAPAEMRAAGASTVWRGGMPREAR